ncbi:MAG: TetR/AcrR family transcriptional regulator [Ktedonobacteraceae bacterium]
MAYDLTMRIKNKSEGQNESSFIEIARRQQIIEATIQTIAKLGYVQASLAGIAKEIGVSKGVISYHFVSKDDLIEQVIATLQARSTVYLQSQVDVQTSARDKLRACIEASFDFAQAHRDHMVALVALLVSFGSSEARQRFYASGYGPARRYLEAILELGQQTGEFRSLSTPTLATLILSSVDGAIMQWVFDEHAVHLDDCRKELVALFRVHTQKVLDNN